MKREAVTWQSMNATTTSRDFNIRTLHNLKLAAQFYRDFGIEKLCGKSVVYD